MNDKIEEIRARHMSVTWPRLYELKVQIHDDREWLLAEVDRQRAEIERLRADNERLRANLRECACDCSSIRECTAEKAKGNYCLHLNARNALEGSHE